MSDCKKTVSVSNDEVVCISKMIQTRALSQKIQKSSTLIKPIAVSQIDASTIPAAYTKQFKATQTKQQRTGIVDEFIKLQSANELPSNLLVRRDGGRVANDGIKTDVRNDLKKVMSSL